jgi:hypothetical protein
MLCTVLPAAQHIIDSCTPHYTARLPGWRRTLMSRMDTWGTRLRLVSLLYSITCGSTGSVNR